MRFVGDKDISDIGVAIRLVLKEAGQLDISEGAIKLFLKSFDKSGLLMEAEKVLKSEVHQHYGRNTRWRYSGEGLWLVPLPNLRYDALPNPVLSFSLQPYLVAGMTILDGKYSDHDTLVGAIGKPYKLTLPMIFLQAILNESLGHFTLVSKDGTSTTWNVPGSNEPLTLPDDFVARLSSTLESKSVVSWLLSFGAQGRKLAPQVAGCLLGLQFGGKSKNLSLSEQVWNKEIVIAGLTKLYGEQTAKTLFNRESPYLRHNMTNEDALKAILQTRGKEE
ncbi:hypothetical protein ACFLW8_01645 [Chloroflexota bacterium]